MGGSLNICSENGYDVGIMLLNPLKKNLEELAKAKAKGRLVLLILLGGAGGLTQSLMMVLAMRLRPASVTSGDDRDGETMVRVLLVSSSERRQRARARRLLLRGRLDWGCKLYLKAKAGMLILRALLV